MNIPNSCDVVVIGGGPAGSATSIELGKKGYDVVLLEKAKHPRFIVGESLLPHVWRYFDRLGVTQAIEQEGFIKKSGGMVSWDGKIRQLSFGEFGYDRPGLHVERDRFDYLLFEHARASGARVYEQVSVKQINFNDTGNQTVSYSNDLEQVTGEISCKYVVDASGQSAVLMRQMKTRQIDKDYRFVSLWGYFKNSKYIAADGNAYPFDKIKEIPPNTFVCSLGEWGWAWHIALRESTSVGLIIPLDKFKQEKIKNDNLENYFLHVCKNTNYLNKLLDEAQYITGSLNVIRDYSYVPDTLSGPGFFITGDAAAFVDPIFSIGVTIALASGCLAAWAIDRNLCDPSKRNSSQAIYNKQFTAWYELARSMALPGKSVNKQQIKNASHQFQFLPDNEQNLLYAASLLTSRSSNIEAIIGPEQSKRLLDRTHLIQNLRF